jgi:hypothetical protein
MALPGSEGFEGFERGWERQEGGAATLAPGESSRGTELKVLQEDNEGRWNSARRVAKDAFARTPIVAGASCVVLVC